VFLCYDPATDERFARRFGTLLARFGRRRFGPGPHRPTLRVAPRDPDTPDPGEETHIYFGYGSDPDSLESATYKADRATAAAGVYNLTVSASGRIRGASAAGVALTGTSTLPEPGRGTLKLADGSRLKFRATRTSAEIARLEAGQMRLIVLSNGRLRGVGKTRQGADGDQLVFFIRSAAG
jgi:hypothetical protein